jgi:hypothetical protein
MPNLTVNTTNVTLTSSLTGFRTVLVQNLSSNTSWAITTDNVNATVNSSNGIAIAANATIPFPLHQEYLRIVSANTSDIRYT